MQRNETIKNLFPGYYRKHDQDMETLADLTKRAKGDERSINEFARVCGVSPSTISRLINKKNTTPNKDSLIKPLINDFLRKMAKFRHQENQDVSAGTRIRFFIDKPAAMISFPRAVIKYL